MTTLLLAPKLELPIDAITQRIAIMGMSGSGKSNTAAKYVETLLTAGAQVVVLDNDGSWYGLRLAADGKGKGFDIPVFGGLHGDIPLDYRAGALIADLIVDRSISVVLDVSMFRKGQRRQFATDLAEQLFHRKKEKRSPMSFVVEEAQDFIPQRVQKGEERMLGAFEDIGKAGRKYGIGIVIISQRPQAVNKDALNQAELLFVHQTYGKQERKALSEWIVEKNMGVDILNELPSLAIGEAYVWSPRWLKIIQRVQISKKWTFDAAATPKFGTKAIQPRALEPLDLEQIQAAMKDVIKQAEENDPRALKREVERLRHELSKQVVLAKPEIQRVEVRVEVPVITDEQLGSLRDITRNLLEIAATAEGVSKDISAALMKARGHQQALASVVPLAPRPAAVPAASAPKARASVPTAGGITEKEQRILNALGTFAAIGLTSVNKANLAAVSGISPRSSELGKAFARLRASGLIEYSAEGGNASLTDRGVQHVRPAERLVSVDALHQAWLKVLNAKEGRVISVLINHYPRPVSKEDLAQQAGISLTSSEFGKVLASLRALEIADYPQAGYVGATELLFPVALARS